jgi:hypothetical protein
VLISLILVIAIATGVYASGVLDEVVDPKPTREPSSDTVQVYSGDGFSLEVPREWNQTAPTDENTAVEYTAPDGASFAVALSDRNAKIPDQADVAAMEGAVVALVVAVIVAKDPGVKVVSRAPSSLGPIPGERITLEGTARGSLAQLVVDGVIVDHRLWFIGLAGPPEAVAEQLPAYNQAAASFRFE